MTKVIAVRYQERGKTYYSSVDIPSVDKGSYVVVETDQGPEYALCTGLLSEVSDEVVAEMQEKTGLFPITRLADAKDEADFLDNREAAVEAFEFCAREIERHGLPMELVGAEYNLDRSRLLFYFTADGRVDFRRLVRDLASAFRTRIELRQIGVRDEAALLGGLGACGRELCCATFLDEFRPVSIKMAKEQNLSMNPAKISGACGRLLCCLRYEEEAYRDAKHRLPRKGDRVRVADGSGVVEQVNLLREILTVRLDGSNDELEIVQVPAAEAEVLSRGKSGKAKAARSEED
ncbi:MAG: stage 0 sporulation family protein [Eubacteriales bacterium]|nr:stage 0 sporulation family protein [Eubacteriales bacterium]